MSKHLNNDKTKHASALALQSLEQYPENVGLFAVTHTYTKSTELTFKNKREKCFKS